MRLLDSDAATMTRTVQRLEQAGLVRRRPWPTDKRASLVEPTAASHALRREVEGVRSRLEGLVTAELSTDERTAALLTPERLAHNLALAAAGPADTDAERWPLDRRRRATGPLMRNRQRRAPGRRPRRSRSAQSGTAHRHQLPTTSRGQWYPWRTRP